MNTTDMRYTMKCKLSLLLAALMLLLPTSCDKDIHENEYPLADGQGALIVGLESEAEVNALAVYIFGDDGGTTLYKAYGDPHILASEYIQVNAGSYTAIIVANADNEALPQETTASDLTEWLNENCGAYPGLLTASVQTEIKAGEMNRIHLRLTDGTRRNEPHTSKADGRHKWHPPFHGAPRALRAWA